MHEKGLQRQNSVGPLVSSQERRASSRNALECARDACLLGEPIRRRPVLPCPALPRRSAVRRPTPTRPWYVCPGFGLNRFGFTEIMRAQHPNMLRPGRSRAEQSEAAGRGEAKQSGTSTNRIVRLYWFFRLSRYDIYF